MSEPKINLDLATEVETTKVHRLKLNPGIVDLIIIEAVHKSTGYRFESGDISYEFDEVGETLKSVKLYHMERTKN